MHVRGFIRVHGSDSDTYLSCSKHLIPAPVVLQEGTHFLQHGSHSLQPLGTALCVRVCSRSTPVPASEGGGAEGQSTHLQIGVALSVQFKGGVTDQL